MNERTRNSIPSPKPTGRLGRRSPPSPFEELFELHATETNGELLVHFNTHPAAALIPATVTAASPLDGGYRWESITPIDLVSGQTYAVMMLTGPDSPFSYKNGGVTPDTTHVTISDVLSTNSNGADLPATYGDTNQWSDQYYHANIGVKVCD